MTKLPNLCRFLDNLPELADSSLMVKFTIFMTGNYRPFIRQCLSNTINLSQSTLACVLLHRRHLSRSGRATGMTSKSKHHHGSRAKKCPTQEGMHMGDYKIFARALGWDRFARIYHRLVISLYLYHLFKNILTEYINYDLTSSPSSPGFLRDFRFLDCLLLGRFRFVGRTNKISAEIANIFLFAFLVYRVTIHSTVPKFKFFALEFLMSGHAEVLKQEFKNVPSLFYQQIPIKDHFRVSAIGPTPFGDLHHHHHRRRRMLDSERRGSMTTAKNVEINSIYYLRSPFDLQESKWILRLNRTGKSWLALNLCTKLLIYWSILALIIWFALLYSALAGSILTNTGFEMSYPSCVVWLRDMQRTTTAANNYSHIYLAPTVLAHEIRIDDLPAKIALDTNDFPRANLYNFARIAFDIIENHMLYLEFILIFNAQFYLLAISSIDVILNAIAIKARLMGILEKLETHRRLAHEHSMRTKCYSKFIEANRQFETNQRQQSVATLLPTESAKKGLGSKSSANYMMSYNRHLSLPAAQVDELDGQLDDEHNEGLAEEIADLQAILADHFDTITRGYNLFISFFADFLLLIWLSYTVVICAWIVAVKSRAIEWEFLIAESGGTVFAVILLSGAAFVRSQNVQLYPLIARAMALDSVSSPTKTRWTIILKYFHPKPFFCFTIMGSTELSLLLCLKLLSWILSAFILLANFYYINRF